MTRLVSIGLDERDSVLAFVQQHLDEGGLLTDLPRFVMYAMAGACPDRSLSRLQDWMAANAYTAAVATADRVDVGRLIARLNAVRSTLSATLAAQARLAEQRAIEHAERKARARFARGKAGNGTAFVGFPNARAVQAAGGVAALLDGAWTSVETTMNRAVDEAAAVKGSILRDVLPPEEVKVLAERYRRRGLEAIAVITATLAMRAGRTIEGTTRGMMSMSPIIRAATGYIEGSRLSLDVNFDRQGQAVPPDISATLRATDPTERLTWLWYHGFYGEPEEPFDPHVEIDQTLYTTAELDELEWYPGDHVGCTCETLPQLGPA